MRSFAYERPVDTTAAIAAGQRPGARFIGGGTNLLDLMKGGVERPDVLVDLNRLPLADIATNAAGGVSIGALARNSDVADHPSIRTRYPLLSQALVAGASAQLRNMAMVGGNLMQRTRCYYFTDPAFLMCNKRVPGSGCGALEGHQRIHAILGASDACIAVNPSDMSVALAALDATVRVTGARGMRTIAFEDFHRLPGDHPERDTTLEPGELIVAVDLPPSSSTEHSTYLKIRDRASYAFALVSVAVAFQCVDGAMREVRIALGGVAHKPWRAREAEALLAGRRPDDDAAVAAAAAAIVRDAKPYPGNRFKVELVRRAIVRAVRDAGSSA